MINKLKFNLDFLPSYAHYNNLRNFFKPEIWKEIVKNIREYKNYQCEFCKRQFNKNDKKTLKYLHCHEYWIFDFQNKRQILLDILLLCNNCHNTQHINLSFIREWDDKTINHYKKINNLSNSEFNELKRDNLLYRKNYVGKNYVSRKDLDEVQIWFFKNEFNISKVFIEEKELGMIIEKMLYEVSKMNF